METMEGQTKPNIASKRIKFLKIVEKGEHDRISELPDCLLLEILSRLPSTTYAIRTGALSKRWKHLWTSVPSLIFNGDYYRFSKFVFLVDKTLAQRRQLKLKKFDVNGSFDSQFESQINNWIRYAISCNVEEFNLKFSCSDKFPLDPDFFINTCFTDLTLKGCIFNPIGAISWKNLRSMCISYRYLDEHLIENILCGSPLLETLELDYCHGYRRLNIPSKSVKNLVFSGYLDIKYMCDEDGDIIEINAPNILSLTIKDELVLWKLLLVNVSSVVEANLDYIKGGRWETTLKQEEEEMLKGFILNLRHVKELKIGAVCSQVVSRLEAKGFNFPSNIKFPDVP